MINKFLLLLALLIISDKNYALDIIIKNAAYLPVELQLAIETINRDKVYGPSETLLVEKLDKLNATMKKLKQNEAHFIIKSEFYKSVLEQSLNKPTNFSFITAKNTAELKSKVIKMKGQLNPFAEWLSLAILSDIEDQVTDKLFEYAKELRPVNRVAISIQNKMKILSPWFQFLNTSSAATINSKSYKIIFSTIDNLMTSTKLFNELGISFRGKKDLTTDLYTLKVKKLKKDDEITPTTIKNKVSETTKKAEELMKKVDVKKAADKKINKSPSNNSKKNWKPKAK